MSSDDTCVLRQARPTFRITPHCITALEVSQETLMESEIVYSLAVVCVQGLKRFSWYINRTYKEFQQLEKDCVKLGSQAGKWVGKLKDLPSTEDFQDIEDPDGRLMLLCDFLVSLQTHPVFSHVPLLSEFLEVSNQSFLHSEKRKEGFVQKRRGGRIYNEKQKLNLSKYFKFFQKRWMFFTDTSLCYKHNAFSETLREAMPLQMCEVASGMQDTGYCDGVCVNGERRRLLFRAGSAFKAKEWHKAINKVQSATSLPMSPRSAEIRYSSAFPVREDVEALWLVDGGMYFYAVLSDLVKARREVLITDWWLSPELYLQRSRQSQLRDVLLSLASRGVKVYIIVYREVASFLYNNSAHVQALESLDANIRVVRHPGRDIAGGEFYWTHHEKSVVIDRAVGFMGGLDLCFGRWDTAEHKLFDEEGIWPGIDYSNPRICDFSDVEDWERDSIDRKTVPRMPWHDVGIRVCGQAAGDLASHFTEVWNHAQTDFTSPYSQVKHIIAGSGPVAEEPKLERSATMAQAEKNEETLEKEALEKLGSASISSKGLGSMRRWTCTCQLLRSGCGWSLGSLSDEHSILDAYLHLISQSRSFIYIENQFFISSTAGPAVKNGIADALVQRIARAHKEQQPFRVIVVLPLLPAFEGKVGENKAAVLRLQMYWQYQTINRGNASLFSRLSQEHGIDPEDYIKFYSLRTWGMCPDGVSCVSELIYVHSKLMIVDDDIVLIGSANINDRSQLGTRDCELAIVVEDNEKVKGRMAGKDVRVSKFAVNLRLKLYSEFSHLSEEILSDPLSTDFQVAWDLVARSNADIYHHLFNAIPDDHIGTFNELAEVENSSHQVPFSSDSLQQLKGFLVPFPLHFLEHEDLNVQFTSKEWWMGANLFV